MDKKHNNQKTLKDKFKEGCIAVFKKWAAFRIAIDSNPKILTYYNEDKTVLEINEMLETLYDELYGILASKSKFGSELLNELADCLGGFIDDYFQIRLEDESDLEVAEILIKLFNSLSEGKEDFYTKLLKSEAKIKYSIDFPILGNQKIIFEKAEEDDEDDAEEEEEEEDEKKRENKKSEKEENKMETDEPDEDGFIEVRKKKKKGKGC